MERVPEPELMEDEAQARAYAEADFEAPHAMFVEQLQRCIPDRGLTGTVLDLGCGPADITLRVARAFPDCRLHGVDGAQAMLKFGFEAVARAGLSHRVRLVHGRLPEAGLAPLAYDAVISNSLLHHLADPAVLWRAVRSHGRPGAPVFVMDLLRPADRVAAEVLCTTYAAEAPALLRRDFYNSLLAAYRPEEVRVQLTQAGLSAFAVETVSDRHWIAYGRLP